MKKIRILIFGLALLSFQYAAGQFSSSSYLGQVTEEESSLLSSTSETMAFMKANSGSLSMDDGFFQRLADVNMPRKSYFFNVGFGASYLKNEAIDNSDWNFSSKPGFQFSGGIYTKLTPLVAYGFGIGLSSYSSEISISSIRDTLSGFRDPDNVTPQDDYDKRITYSSISQSNTLLYLDIPVFIEFGNPNVDKIGYFIRAGVKVSHPIHDSFKGMGNYSINGYYPDYPVEISGVPELGFVSQAQMFTEAPAYELNPIVFSGSLSAGITIPLSNIWLLSLGAKYTHGLTDIAKLTDHDPMALLINKSHLLEQADKGTLSRSLAFEVGIQYITNWF